MSDKRWHVTLTTRTNATGPWRTALYEEVKSDAVFDSLTAAIASFEYLAENYDFDDIDGEVEIKLSKERSGRVPDDGDERLN